jgi:aconitate hydratase
MTLAEKIINDHLLSGTPKKGKRIVVKIDQTLTQDATGTVAYLQFEALGIPRVKTELSLSYVDHNTLQQGYENADDHLYLQTVAAKYGVVFSRPGNGICHQIHLERFGIPGKTLLGSDSHTPTGGGIGMIAIGAGGLDVSLAMGGYGFNLTMPEVTGIRLTGHLQPNVTAKDVILEVLRVLSVKGGVGKIMEYFGEGVKTLSVPERATITNMGAELGATTSLFPSDERTLSFLTSEGREYDYVPLSADDENYDSIVDICLDKLEPMVARPHMPDNVCRVKDIEGMKIQQVLIGSCTNSSYKDMMAVAAILKGKKVHSNVNLGIAPGSRQVMMLLAQNGALTDILLSGARLLEATCGPCIGMGQAPPSEGVTLRTFNRNFEGRSGTQDADIYLVSPETAAASVISGVLTDPRSLDALGDFPLPERIEINDNLILRPPADSASVQVIRGPNIKPLPRRKPWGERLKGKVLIKVGDNITTDDILPAGAKILPLRSNIPAISRYTFSRIDPDFADRAQKWGGGFVVGGSNYGQGSSREHAALAPMSLGVLAVVAKSFARIHQANLINFGILPLTFKNPPDYDLIGQGEEFELVVRDLNKGLILRAGDKKIAVTHTLTPREMEILKAGGALAYAGSS